MAKTKAPTETTKTFDGERADFSDPLTPVGPETRVNDDGVVEAVRGPSLQADIDGIRQRRASERSVRGKPGRRRRITNYVDAERLRNLRQAGHTHLVTSEELVDCEEAGYFGEDGIIKPGMVTVGPDAVPNGTIAPPQAPTPVEVD